MKRNESSKLLEFAKSLAAVKEAPWDKVKLIYSSCPHTDVDECFVIQPHSLDGIIALGTYYIQSRFKHTDKILPYLLNLLSGLKEAKWPPENEITSSVSLAERLAFCLNTLLSEVSVNVSEDIYEYQLNEIIAVSSKFLNTIKFDIVGEDQENYFVNTLIPILYGLSQSMGRYKSHERSVFCYIFPSHKSYISVLYHIKNVFDARNLFSLMCQQFNHKCAQKCHHVFERVRSSCHSEHLINIFEIVRNLLSENNIRLFSRSVCKIERHLVLRLKISNHYLTELLKSGLVILFRDLFCYQIKITLGFMQSIKEFCEELFAHLHKDFLSIIDNKSINSQEIASQKLQINIFTTINCLEILNWAVKTVNDAEDLCARVTKLLNNQWPDKFVMINAPLLIACFEILGNLADRFRPIAGLCVNALRDFLSLPSQSLNQLCQNKFLSFHGDSNSLREWTLKTDQFHYHIFKKVQYAAIENICISLRSTYTADSNNVAAFLTSFSCLLYMEKFHPHYDLVTENVVVTLAHLSFSVPTFSKSILQCFQQRLCRHSVESDIAIIHQLGNLIILNEYEEICLEILKIFCNLVLEVNNDVHGELKHISDVLFTVLIDVAEKLHSESKVISVFIRLLEIFVQVGLEDYQCSDISVFQKNAAGKSNQNKLLQIISLLAEKIPINFKFKKQQERLFQDFWLYFVLSKDSIFCCLTDPYLKAIVPKLPLLISESLTDHDLREFFYSSTFNRAKISAGKQNDFKIQLLNFLQNSGDVCNIVNRFTLPQILYSLSICLLEIIRIENVEDTSIEPLFSYLTNQKLQKDKYGMWQCLCKIVEQIFERFILVLSQKERNDAREIILVKQAQFLLIHFNNINPQIRHISDKFLSELIGRFPHLLWNREVIWSLLDILSVLFYSLQINPSDEIAYLEVPSTNRSIFLSDTRKLREDIFNDFVARSREIISESKKWAPAIINSHLQEYILKEKNMNLDDDPISSSRHHAWTLLCTNQGPYAFEISDILTSLSMRSQYLGEVSGLLEKSNLSVTEFVQQLCESVWLACEENDLLKYECSLQRSAAFVVSQSSMLYELKQVLATSHLKFFTGDVLKIVVQCWNWICTAIPNFELDILKEVFLAWKFTIDKRMCLFSEQNVMSCCSYGSRIKSELCNHSDPHEIWVQFIIQVIEGAKYNCQEILDLLVDFFHRTLPMSIGGSDCHMMRDIDNLVSRFSLLSSILSLLQSDISVNCFNKIIIRQRVYCSCLDYFCSLKKFPRKTGLSLKSRIEILIKFWHLLYSEKKYIVASPAVNVTHMPTAKPNDTGANLLDLLTIHPKTLDSDGPQLENMFLSDFRKKRKLSLCLLAEEIQSLSAWYNPCDQLHFFVQGEDVIRAWRSKFFSAVKSIKDIAKTAWEISPILAVYLPLRIKNDEITSEISNLILLNPAAVSHIPHAVEFLASAENVQKDCKALAHLLSWAKTSPIQALSLLSQNYVPNSFVLSYATKTLLNSDVSILVYCIPQLVQSLRHDPMGYIGELIKALAQKSPLICHQILWNMKSNMYTDVSMTQKSTLYDKLYDFMNDITANLSGLEKVFYLREFKFIDQIAEVSSQIPRNLKREERKQACLKALNKIKIKPGCYFPSNPEALIFDIDNKSGTPLQSKSRTPYLAKFKVAHCTLDKLTEIGMKVSQQEMAGFPVDDIIIRDPELTSFVWQSTIFKAGDDVRQDILALQVIKLLEQRFVQIGLDVFLFPYNVTAIAPGMGIIECVPNASSRDELGKQTDVGLYDYFITTFGDEKSTRFRNAQRNFIKSVAAYSVVNFLLQIKDRHNGNILVDDEGHIIHIDFGFMFESSPGGNLGFEPDMKLTEEMVMIMGGKMESEPFQWFTELCVKAYLAARSCQEDIITLVTHMLDSGLPCFRGQTIKLLRGRFAPNASDREAADYIITVIRNSFLNFRTVTYDMLQYLQNSIKY